jgi:hypothetical protein
VAASLVCRAWRQATIELIMSQRDYGRRNLKIESLFCGLQLNLIVGLDGYLIKRLSLDMKLVGKEYIKLIAPFFPKLYSLNIYFEEEEEEEASGCRGMLEVFFVRCPLIRSLYLVGFDFGDSPSNISQAIKDGLYRLRSLDLWNCCGNMVSFVEEIPVPNLREFSFYTDYFAEGYNASIISAIAAKYRSLTSVYLLGGCKIPIQKVSGIDKYTRFF